MVGPMSLALAPLRQPARARLADQVVSILLDAVLDGQISPGSKLPPERELAAELDVNRTSLRQAIARLEQMGVVAARQGRGTVVLDPRESSDSALMAHLVVRDRRAMLTELFEVRASLAALIGRAAAARGTAKERSGLREDLHALVRAEDARERQQLELDLFRRLVTMARNRPLSSMQRWVDAAYGEAADLFVDAFSSPEPLLAGLTPLVQAVVAGDEKRAAAAAETYAIESGERLLAAASRPARRKTTGASR